MKEFILDGVKVKAGDEIKVITREKKKYNGILIGAKKIEQIGRASCRERV